jgi:hypothetical protein
MVKSNEQGCIKCGNQLPLLILEREGRLHLNRLYCLNRSSLKGDRHRLNRSYGGAIQSDVATGVSSSDRSKKYKGYEDKERHENSY